ncbi:MAG: excalibur calcium-binding domain-containing protein [Pseudomonadota bacterium]
MGSKFIAATGLLSALTFGGVWLAVPPSRSGSALPAVPTTYFSGCDAARAAGAAPLHRGQPGYRAGMDGDGDGIACEPYRGHGGSGSHGRRRRR